MSDIDGRVAAQRTLAGLVGRTVTPEPVHDAAYWRGALAVINERQERIRAELTEANRHVFDLEQAQTLTAKARIDAVLASRNVLTRTQAGRILGITPGSVTAMITGELRRRGMGVQR